jgi:hypothetical protein
MKNSAAALRARHGGYSSPRTVTSPENRGSEISALKDRREQGDAGAAEALFAELYSELHRQRRRQTRGDSMGGAAEG